MSGPPVTFGMDPGEPVKFYENHPLPAEGAKEPFTVTAEGAELTRSAEIALAPPKRTRKRSLPVVAATDTLSTGHSRPKLRGDCLTSARRYELARMYTGDGLSLPEPGGWDTSDPTQPIPTDGLRDGWNAERPCAFFGCKYHVSLEFNHFTGAVTVMWKDDDNEMTTAAEDAHLLEEFDRVREGLKAWHKTPEARIPGAQPPTHLHTCGLDLADMARESGDLTLEQIGAAQRKTRERIRQVAQSAFRHAALSPEMQAIAAREGEESYPLPEHLDIPPVVVGDRVVEVLRRNGQALVVECDGCHRPFGLREPMLVKLGAPLCPACLPRSTRRGQP